MLLSLIVYTQALKWVIPTAVMLGSAPCFITVWSAWRLLTAVLPRRFYRRGDDILYSSYQRLVLFFFENYTGVELFLYGDVDALTANQENVLYLSNHQCTVDWVVCDMLAVRQGALGTLRYILKDGLRYIPLYGFYLAQHDCMFVRRSGKFNQARADRQLARLKRDNTPTWLVIFPEGTRFNPELNDVIQKSQQFARDQGFEEFHEVLTPRYKGFLVSLKQMRSYLDAVYDVTIAYTDTQNVITGERMVSPGMPDYLEGKSPRLHLHVSRISIEDVPNDEDKLRHWLMQRFQEKEKLLSHFYRKNHVLPEHKSFPGEPRKSKLSLTETLPSFLLWGGLLTTVLATEQGRSLYWKVALGGTLAGCVWMAIRS